MRRFLFPLACVLAVLSMVVPARAGSLSPPESTRATAAAAGLGVNLPLVARLIGAGPTLYVSAVDVQNNAATATQADWFVNGVNLRTSAVVSTFGSISSTGTLVAQGAGGLMRGRSSAHFDDMIDSLIQGGFLSPTLRDDGFIGSVLFVFNGYKKKGQGAATVRFFNSLAGGTVGQSLKGHEISAAEPQRLVAFARDTRGKPGAQLYANIFVNNVGLTPGGVGAAGPVTVRLEAYANSTGQPTGTPLDTVIGIGQTVGFSDVLAQLKVPPGEDTVIVYASVISGTSAIAGAFTQVDAITRDGSATDMSPANF